ncbi:MAG: 3-methyladenine DNA glycosylase AlkC [Alphaproteobacteria bacterium]|jgi:3-methyladenine DNA glycosylase AlkC
MPEAFKHRFNVVVITQMAGHITSASQHFDPNDVKNYFDSEGFIKTANLQLESLELKARSNQIKDALLKYMPRDFIASARILTLALAPACNNEDMQFDAHDQGLCGWMMMPITDYVAESSLKHGSLYLHDAFALMHACTQRFSAEFSIRPFLRDHTNTTLQVLTKWAQDDNLHVRRLVSEGCRPYLPWGLRLHVFANEPSLILPLLEALKDDPSEYVRRSVANNLNDIAKDHPDTVAGIAAKWWDEKNKQRTKLIKHACRTLLKNGHPNVLALFGFAPAKQLDIVLTLQHKRVKMGEVQEFALSLINKSGMPQTLLIDYAMFHQKANGKMTPKVFKWTSIVIPANAQQTITKRHSFKAVTTRRYYQGQHKIEISVNGKVFAKEGFELFA